MEPFYPLHVYVCHACFLVQLDEIVTPREIFGDGQYAYFSSYSESWMAHVQRYVNATTIRFGLSSESMVVEIGSNDGYLLKYFIEKGIPALGIDPAFNTAEAARQKGVNTHIAFFSRDTADRVVSKYGKASLIIGNNVLAHVSNINDFVAGLKTLLKPEGVVTMEYPHLMQLVEGNQFDTIYHEHFSYLSFTVTELIFATHGLTVFDVEELPTHGGSLRIYAKHSEQKLYEITDRVATLKAREKRKGMQSLNYYQAFSQRVNRTKRDLLEFLIQAKKQGKCIVGYGAPGKGNTLLNYCGIRTDFLDYTVDRSPHKQGNYLPGTRIPIRKPDEIYQTKPDYVLILPWNIKDEIISQLAAIRDWGGRFVVPIPKLSVFE